MMTNSQHGVDWKQLARIPGFRWFFLGMLVSLFGTGMNYAAVTWYILGVTHSTVSVSWIVILVTLPGLFVPPFGGVLIDRVDRRYLAMAFDFARSLLVLGTAALALTHRITLGEIYLMVLLLGAGFAVYWSTANSLVQELIPAAQIVTANAAVLVAVQAGMMAAGAVVGFIYEHWGLGGILAIDGATYFISGLCLLAVRHGWHPPEHSVVSGLSPSAPLPLQSRRVELSVEDTSRQTLPGPAGISLRLNFSADLDEGLRYLRAQPLVFALGLTYACMMAGVLSANVLVVALAKDVLAAGPRGYGFIESGWAVGAVVGGLAAFAISRRHPLGVLVAALAILSVGHTLFPYARWIWVAVAMNALFGACRALGGVLTQSALMMAVPRRLMGRTLSAFSVIATILQVVMSFLLGWFAEHSSLMLAFLLLGMLYALAVAAALRARSLASPGHAVPLRSPAP
jgi:MFS transporter, DHA3 family, macrolide efflux protein